MKKKLVGLLSALLFGASVFMLFSYNSNPPNGRTGAPGEGSCSNCHSSSGGGFGGSLEISGLPSNIEAGNIYQLTITSSYSSGSPNKAGFQMVGLDEANDNSGSMANASASSTITESGGRTYHEHNPSQLFGASSSVSWTVDWTAPDGPNGEEITFYASSMIVNGNGNNQGDDLVLTTVSGILEATVSPLEVLVVDESGTSCFGESDGSAELEVSGGQMPYSYSWDNGESANPAIELSGGSHFVTVEDDLGTTVEVEVSIAEPDELMILDDLAISNSCPDSEDGSISFTVEGGSSPYSYEWSNGSNDSELAFLGEGFYSVTVIDDNACEAYGEWELISQFDAPDVVITGPSEICPGMDVELSVDGDFALYEWSTGDFTPSISINEAGLYSVVVTDDNGCNGEGFFDVSESDLPDAGIIESSNDFCNGEGMATLEAVESGLLSYVWSTGATTESIDVGPGLYSLTVTNSAGCDASSEYELIAPDDLLVFVDNLIPNDCFGESSAMLVADAEGGVPPYEFEWYDAFGNATFFSAGETLNELSAGDYLLVVGDSNFCTDTLEVQITDPTELQSNLVVINESEAGANDGQASVDPSGGTMPYQEAFWSNGVGGNEVSGLSPGSYSVTISDANDCVLVEDFVISPGNCNLTTSHSSTDVSCFGGSDGTISVSVENGVEPYTFSWSNGISGSEATLTGLSAGTYSVDILDSNGCEVSINDILVNQPDELSMQLIIMNETLPGANDGAAEASVSGGTLPYDIAWSNGANGASVSGLAPGEYTVTVTDANGCSYQESFVVESGEAIDSDGDGYTEDEDCDDENPDINPGAEEIANNDVDENCDGIILVIDEDGDGYNSDEDCDDNNPDINPGADEIPDNGIDEDCDGSDLVTSNSELWSKNLNVYPNPAKRHITLDLPEGVEFSIKIFNVNGHEMKWEKVNNIIDVSDWDSGIYIIRFFNKESNNEAVKRIALMK